MDGMLIEGVRKDLPSSIATFVTGTYTTWAAFTNAVWQICPNNLLCAQANNARLIAVEQEL